MLSLKKNGETWAWGINSWGQLGDNTIVSRSSPVSVVGNHSFYYIASGYYHQMALKQDGSVWSWGSNSYGQLGTNNLTFRSSPVQVIGNHSFKKIVTGRNHTAGLKADGSVWCWGYNFNGELGTNDTVSYSSPVQVVGNHSFTNISSNMFDSTFGIKEDGSLWGWGLNNQGQLGDNTTVNKSSPVAVVGGISFKSVSVAFNHSTIALDINGQAWCWGSNSFGQLGTNNLVFRSSPVQVVGNHSFIQVDCGTQHMGALKSDGQIWAWGFNNNGEIGNNTALNSYSSPVQVVGNHSFISIFYSGANSFALKSNGQIWGWGFNDDARLGDGTVSTRSSPVQIIGNHSFLTFKSGINAHIQLNGWKRNTIPHIKLSSGWKRVISGYVLVNGTWRRLQ